MSNWTTAKHRKLATIIGKLEALQHQVPDEKAWLRDAKSLLLKVESDVYRNLEQKGLNQ